MEFASPIWLIAFLPWAAVVGYLLLGLKSSASVPFINLWRGDIARAPARRSLQRLPRWIALLLAAAAIGILAAGGPRVQVHGSDSSLITGVPATIGIQLAAARSDQLMVRLRNASPASRAELIVETDRSRTTNPIDLPPSGESRDYFFDLPKDAMRVRATVAAGRPVQRGEQVDLLRSRPWPLVRAITPLPAEVTRIIDIYSRRRSPSGEWKTVTVAAGSDQPAGDSPAVILATGSTAGTGTPDVTPHAITADVDWTAALANAKFAAAPPPPGWTPIVALAGRPIIAVRDQPVRQVWIGFDSPSFPRSPAFVVFWTNVLDWTGEAAETFQPSPGTVFASDSPKAAEPAVPPAYDYSPWLACLAIGLSAVAGGAVPKPFA